MILLHLSLLEGVPLLWGESPAPEQAVTKARRGRPPRVPVPQQLPFGTAAADLLTALKGAGVHLEGELGPAVEAVAWLPTVEARPVASSPLIAPPPESTAGITVAPWVLEALPLTTRQTVDLLGACLDRHTLASGLLVGPSLAYGAAALRFAGALLAREQFLPSLEGSPGEWRACWKPVLGGLDRTRFHQLARAMPAACRAMTLEAEAAPGRPAAVILEEFLASAVDALARSQTPRTAVALPTRRGPRQKRAFDSLHDQWLHALTTPDGAMPGSDAELAQLAEQVRAWQRPVLVAVASPFRLCFRLEEPAANGDAATYVAGGDWTVRYLLQAQEDPSLLIPVADAWQPRGRLAGILHRDGFQPREYLLTALGQAAGLCAPIQESLKAAEPSEFPLDGTGAHQFLAETSWVLEQAGFGVLLPAWWTRKGTKQRLTLTAHAKSPRAESAGGLSLEELVRFDWRVALGEHTLTPEELETLARLKSPLVRVRGQWVQVSAEEIQAALAFWKARGQERATVRDLVKMALGAAEGPAGLQVRRVTADGWVGELLERLQGEKAFAELPPPATLAGTLRPYQVRGYSWLAFLRQWGLGACLADDMGLGKTVQTLALIQKEREAGERRPVLLVCPMSVVGNWKREAERFTPELPVLIHHGAGRSRSAAFAREAKRHGLVLTSYALLHRDLKVLEKVRWAGIVLDEAQNIKNPETKQAQAARALSGDYRVALTGTPVENHVGDLWSLWQFLNPGFLGSRTEFRREFFVPIQVQRDPEAAARLRRLTGPFLLRRLKTDKAVIADLPDKLEMKVYCNLTREQASLYAAVVEELGSALQGGAEGIQRKGLILGALSKLKQVCNHPVQFLGDNSAIPGRSGKLARLTEMLEEVLETGDRALVFTQFVEMGEIIRTHLQETFGREVLFLHGGVSRKQRDALVARFQAAEGGDAPRILLLSLRAGGTGLNLTAANHVFHFDRWWNPAVENQATDRAFRIGQARNVQVHKFVCVGTLEEKIDAMIEQKQQVAGQVVGTGEAWLTELSNTEIRELFALRADAVGE